MPELNPPLYMSVDEVYAAPALGLPWRDVIGEGVIGDGLLVEPTSPAELAVNVRAGSCWIVGDDDPARQGAYRCRSDSVKKVNLAPNPGGQTRPDRIIAEVEDADFAGDERVWRLRVEQGSPGGQPPNVPTNAIALCTVVVPAAASSIAAGDLTDTRARAVIGGGDAVAGLIGSPIPWLLPTIPPGYLEFAGQAITAARYPKLYALFGATLPDLRNRMLLGASGPHPVTEQGGFETVVITPGQMPWHGHVITVDPAGNMGGWTDVQGWHGHSTDAVASGQTRNLVITGSSAYSIIDRAATINGAGSHSHNVGVNNHGHTASAGGAGGNEAHPNLPPYRSVYWITVAG